ncbi:MAG: hypothetical protein GF398_05780 [Chitinivibrionales bacterium]|nr:hypothetical protein [Chitinivibrionales bacterium]
MKLLKRIAVNIQAKMEDLTSQIENKEALTLSYIREYERVVAKAKIRLSHVKGDALRLEKDQARLQQDEINWKGRARKVYADDEAKALECMRRAKRAQTEHQKITVEIKEVRELEIKMERDVERIQKKLETVKHRQRALAGRQSCAEALHSAASLNADAHEGLDDLLTRWETDVVASELQSDSVCVNRDSLTDEFDKQEEEADLKCALDELMTKSAE